MENDRIKPRKDWAKSLAQKIHSEIGTQGPPILINDVIKHLKKSHNLSVYAWSFGDNVDGIQVTHGKEATIGFNANKHPHRKRFTVAHEIGHFLMGHTRGNIEFDLESPNPGEIEANQFAAELLIPISMLKSDIKSGRNNVKGLSSRYNVSEQAMMYKLMEAKLLEDVNNA